MPHSNRKARRCFLTESVRWVSGFSLLIIGSVGGYAEGPGVPAVTPPSVTLGSGGESLFDGKTLKNWKKTEFSGGGEVRVEEALIVVDPGEELSGFNFEGVFPTDHYEFEMESERLSGLDFFATLTFPVGNRHLSFVVGGWGGSVVGISSVNREDASRNETTSHRFFQDRVWYRIRLRVEGDKIQAWINGECVVDLATAGKELELRPGEIELSRPFGVATFRTGAAFRNLRIRKLPQSSQ